MATSLPCFSGVFGIGVSFHDSLILAGFVITRYFGGFGCGLARLKLWVKSWYGNEVNQCIYTH